MIAFPVNNIIKNEELKTLLDLGVDQFYFGYIPPE